MYQVSYLKSKVTESKFIERQIINGTVKEPCKTKQISYKTAYGNGKAFLFHTYQKPGQYKKKTEYGLKVLECLLKGS
jgi:hypothetical protein